MGSRVDDDPEAHLNAIRRARRQLQSTGYVFQFKYNGHFELSLTEKGEEFWEWLQDEGKNWGLVEVAEPTEIPPLPARVGKGHLLPAPLYKKIVRAINAGEIDMLLIPREQKTKIEYWDGE